MGKVVIELFNFHYQSREIPLKLNKINRVYFNSQVKYLTFWGVSDNLKHIFVEKEEEGEEIFLQGCRGRY